MAARVGRAPASSRALNALGNASPRPGGRGSAAGTSSALARTLPTGAPSRRPAPATQFTALRSTSTEPACALRIAKLWSKLPGALRQQIEQVPQRTEIVAHVAGAVGHPQDTSAFPPEYRTARQPAPAFGPKPQTGGKGGGGVGQDRKAPAAPLRKRALHIGRVGARDHEGGTLDQMTIDAVVAVGPQRAVGTRYAHIVDHDEIALIAEQAR